MRTIASPTVFADLTHRLERLTYEHRPRWGAMTAHQMTVHVASLGEAVLNRAPFSMPARAPNRPLKLFALYGPLRWPKNLASGSNPAGEVLAEARFEADRGRAIATLTDIRNAGSPGLTVPHPFFGRMTVGDWHRWAFLHTDHHLRQFGL